jgi:isoquinoline 1-oxidoreductase beta subunit
VDGHTVYSIDFTTPGLLHAALDLAPVFGGKLLSVDPAPAMAMPGVARVVPLQSGVAVVADSWWHARRGLAALRPRYDDAGRGLVTSDALFAAYAQALGTPEVADAATTITAEYRVPFLAHAAMEPLSCTARVTLDRADVWAGVQDPLNARATAAEAAGLPVDQVHFTNFPMGGSFGRRTPYCFDYVAIGVRVAKAMAPRPVKVVWSRENDIQHDYYRPAAMARFAGTLDRQGRPLAIACHYAGGGDAESLSTPYAIADKRAEGRDAADPIPRGWWRSVLSSQHGFFKESFIDEMAHAAGQDPYLFRLGLLCDQPRFRAVLARAAAMAAWGSPLPEGEGWGIALTESFGTIAAQAAHVAVSVEGTLRVVEVCAAVDCGDVVNSDSAAAQIEGGILFGLSAALMGEITIAGGRVVQSNFHDYHMLHLADAPRIRIELMRSSTHLGGLGEACVPAIAPAVANAICAATGRRVRQLPIRNQRLGRRTTT